MWLHLHLIRLETRRNSSGGLCSRSNCLPNPRKERSLSKKGRKSQSLMAADLDGRVRSARPEVAWSQTLALPLDLSIK